MARWGYASEAGPPDMVASHFPQKAEAAAVTTRYGLVSHFHDEHSETENVYHDHPAPSRAV